MAFTNLVVDFLENGVGLNLTYEVRDGILNHAGDNEASTLEGKIIKLADRIAYINHDIDDALRGGIIKESDIPKDCVEVLGNSHGERISTLIKDTIYASKDKETITMSDSVASAMAKLRSFMFETVYVDSQAKGEDEKAREVIKLLFETFIKKPELMNLAVDEIEKKGIEQAVCDYIAGMTDNFAIHKFNEIFIPKKWIVN